MKNDVHQEINAALKNMEEKGAAAITHALGKLGGGNMAIGLKKVMDYVTDEVKRQEWAKGGFTGGAITAVVIGSGVALYKHIKRIHQEKENDEQGQEILTALKSAMTPEEIAAAESGEAPDSTDENL